MQKRTPTGFKSLPHFTDAKMTTDASGNKCSKTRVVKTIDTLKPVIALKYNGKEIDRSSAEDTSKTTSNTRGASNPAADWAMP